MIKLKRVYDPVADDDGTRFLVERLWPRGIKKSDLQMQAWLKDVAPSSSLRQWFSHDPKKWNDFRERYFRELRSNVRALEPLVAAAKQGTVTLLYSSRDSEHNNAVALRDYIASQPGKNRSSHKRVA
jgi:uncharacterized protein YeaO (DUF488 family)